VKSNVPRGDDPEVAAKLRIEERELEAGHADASDEGGGVCCEVDDPVPPDEPADERVAPLRHETNL
jgi:hypothetical protein